MTPYGVVRLFTYMHKEYQTKDVSNKDIAEEKPTKQKYTFPHHGITVEADSLEEAKEKLKQLINK